MARIRCGSNAEIPTHVGMCADKNCATGVKARWAVNRFRPWAPRREIFPEQSPLLFSQLRSSTVILPIPTWLDLLDSIQIKSIAGLGYSCIDDSGLSRLKEEPSLREAPATPNFGPWDVSQGTFTKLSGC
jgi:hypothetical protein